MSADYFKGLEDLAVGISIPILLAVSASFVRIHTVGWRGIKHFLGSVATSILVACLVFWALDIFAISLYVKVSIVGASSYMGGTLLDSIMHRLQKQIEHGKLPILGETPEGKD